MEWETATPLLRTKRPEAVPQFQLDLPTRLPQPLEPCPPSTPFKVFAQDESRVGLWPMIRRRISACGVQLIATGLRTFDNFYLYRAVEPTTGDSFCLELPWLNASAFQLWTDHFAEAFPQSFNIRVLDNGALHKAKAVQWPANVTPVFLPPYSPELNPIKRLWRDLRDKLADCTVQTLDALSAVSGQLLQSYSQTALQSFTGYAYFVQAVETAWQGSNG
jgi:DDE superfamily endonuclease